MTKGELFAEAVKTLKLSEFVDLLCLKATLDGVQVKVTITNPKGRPKK